MLVLSLASGRPAPHNDPFIRLREPWARVSSDKGGRWAPVPLLGGGGVEGSGALSEPDPGPCNLEASRVSLSPTISPGEGRGPTR